LLNAWTIQNTGGATLIIQPAMSSSFYAQLRYVLTLIRDSYNASTKAVSLSSAYGQSWNFGIDGSLTIPGDIKSNSNINIDINLSDSTLRRWQFGEDGALTLPSVGKINNGAYDWTFGSTGNTTFPTGLVLGAPRGPNTVNFTCSVDKEFQIETGTASAGRLWQFGTTGTTTFPSGLTLHRLSSSYSNITADLDKNLQVATQTSGGRKEWSFGTDGALTFPDATVQTTAWKGIPGPYANDAAAAAENVAVGNPYHKTGTSGQVFVRLT
jgi:hypothetical protein